VSEIADRTGYSQAKISRNLGLLFRLGIVTRRRKGHFVYYRVAERGPAKICNLISSQMTGG